jgi:hypothetical protein
MRIVRILGAALAAGALLSGGIATAAEAAPAPDLRCSGHHHRDVRLDTGDNGRAIRVCDGDRIDVALRAPMRGPLWSPIHVDGDAVQMDRHHPRVFPARGMTVGFFVAVHRGQATLTSTRPVCPPNPGGPTCHSMQGWKVDVTVR